ncbi:MAG: hypothetical protein Kow0069_35040 [Promethearchaeota archaeon]
MNVVEDLRSALGERLVVDLETRERYSRDEAGFTGARPLAVSYPAEGDVEALRRVFETCARARVKVLLASSREHVTGCTLSGDDGAVVVDFRDWRTCEVVSSVSKIGRVGAGVTLAKACETFRDRGFRLMVPHGVPPGASLLTTYLERYPLYSGVRVLRAEGWQAFMNLSVVLADGRELQTGSGEVTRGTGPGGGSSASFLPFGPAGPDLSRLFTGAQGSMGAVTSADIKLKRAPEATTVRFVAAGSIGEAVSAVTKAATLEVGECWVVLPRKAAAAAIAAFELVSRGDLKLPSGLSTEPRPGDPNVDTFAAIREARPLLDPLVEEVAGHLPNHLAVVALMAFDPKEIEIDLEDLADLGISAAASPFGDGDPCDSVGVDVGKSFGAEFVHPTGALLAPRVLSSPSEHVEVLPFYVSGNRSEELDAMLSDTFEGAGSGQQFAASLGFAIPIEFARVWYRELYLPSDDDELSAAVWSALLDFGVAVDQPRGRWAKQVFAQVPSYAALVKRVKRLLDPHGLLRNVVSE